MTSFSQAHSLVSIWRVRIARWAKLFRLRMLNVFQNVSDYAGRGQRSTVLQPLGWLVIPLIAGIVAASHYNAPVWVIGILSGLLVLSVVVYVSAFGYFAVTDKDSLRSESYAISKMAIEKGIYGDSATGTFSVPVEEPDDTPRLSGKGGDSANETAEA